MASSLSEPQDDTSTASDSPRSVTRTLSVADRIRSAILSGEHAPGARLHEQRLCERLGVSRTPVRAALQALAGDGLLDHAPNRGYSVRRFDTSEIVDAYEIRAMLEALAARLAAERGFSHEQHEAIETALADGDALLAKQTLTEDDRIAYGAVNFVIHDTIHSAARSRMLTDMIRQCQSVPQSSHRNIISFEYMDVRRRHDDHHRLYDAILARDVYRAEMLMREHVASVKTSLIRALSGRSGRQRG